MTNKNITHTISISKKQCVDCKPTKENLIFSLCDFDNNIPSYCATVRSRSAYLYNVILSFFDPKKSQDENEVIRAEYLNLFKKKLEKYGVIYEFEQVSGKGPENFLDYTGQIKEFLDTLFVNDYEIDLLQQYLFNTLSYVSITHNDHESDFYDYDEDFEDDRYNVVFVIKTNDNSN